MKRFSRSLKLATIALGSVAICALADEPSAAAAPRPDWGHRNAEKCLAQLNLSADQQSAIQAIRASAKPTRQADASALKADREKLRADIASGADKSVLGQDVLNENADRTKMQTDLQTVRDQILAKLTPDQQQAFNACAQAHSWHRAASRPA